jgi:hypothetical protein
MSHQNQSVLFGSLYEGKTDDKRGPIGGVDTAKNVDERLRVSENACRYTEWEYSTNTQMTANIFDVQTIANSLFSKAYWKFVMVARILHVGCVMMTALPGK